MHKDNTLPSLYSPTSPHSPPPHPTPLTTPQNITLPTHSAFILYSQAIGERDENGWTGLHHAANAAQYCWRAMRAAIALAALAPVKVINSQTTGDRPKGYSCLHFASEGSCKTMSRIKLITTLLDRSANINMVCAKGNTPYLLAVSQSDVCAAMTLITARADVEITNNRGLGAHQAAHNCSGTMASAIEDTDGWDVDWVPGAPQATGMSESRHIRHVLLQQANRRDREEKQDKLSGNIKRAPASPEEASETSKRRKMKTLI